MKNESLSFIRNCIDIGCACADAIAYDDYNKVHKSWMQVVERSGHLTLQLISDRLIYGK